MSNSSLVSYRKISPNKSSPRNHIIDSVAIHCMAGNLTVEGCGECFAPVSRRASSNYGVGSDGRIGQYVDEKDRSWCTSNAGVDNRAITIEVADDGSDQHVVTGKAYNALINLLVDICRRNSISSLKWKNDKQHALKAAAGGPVTEQNMFVHRWFNEDKSCPGEFLFNAHTEIAREVNKRIANHIPLQGVVSSDGVVDASTSDSSYARAVQSQSTSTSQVPDSTPTSTNPIIQVMNRTVDYTKLHPFLITLDRYTTSNIDFDKMKKLGVAGGMVEGGYLFDSKKEKVNFRNPKAYTQVKALQDADLPFGYYMTCRPNSESDAVAEMEQFAYLIRKYSPDLGAWVKLDNMSSNKTINDYIMGVYLKEFSRLGLKNKIGVYATTKQLEQISWSKHMNNWYLWHVDYVSHTNDINQLLTPEFFDMEGRYS